MLKRPSENPNAMTVGELVKILQRFPQNHIVMIPERMPNTHCVNAEGVEEDSFVASNGVDNIVVINAFRD